ncbi:MAG: sulfurtransferase TusA [Pseudohongiellaceae bacterium]|jgi:tRNA 2-thiouridine synthesizing protein A
MSEDNPKSGDSSELEPAATLDATGLYCPEPVMMLHNKIRDLAEGDLLKLEATDPSTTRDVPKFCMYLGHELVREEQQGDQYLYWIRKKAE